MTLPSTLCCIDDPKAAGLSFWKLLVISDSAQFSHIPVYTNDFLKIYFSINKSVAYFN